MHCALSIYPHTDNGFNQAMMIAKQNQVIIFSTNTIYQVSNPASFSGTGFHMHVAYCLPVKWYNTLYWETFEGVNFVVLWLFAKVFSAKFGGMVLFGIAQVSNLQKFSQ